MFIVGINSNGSHQVALMKIERSEPHPKLKNHFYYSYEAEDDNKNRYIGKVLHTEDNGAFALLQKVTKAIVATQRAAKAAK